ncbi:methoxymalonyl-ACP biosynthesis protein FkbH [Sinorhizobium glycinis]|uniref:Methoxymalonyl-ACP biosynthesis protein FkbH n=1 Tax=Sinorhizobium glycinis TaxID=1472378 RepID=A0A178XVP1_9HYPH|nr:HAD family hydrolase [Sinorhizobium glycinis]OAP38565.1 methoxymalonyl-ACP biosynthesis protein FkbH [Sinorhizobium glycinis]
MSSLFPWRRPLEEGWGARVSEIEAVVASGRMPDYASVRAAANQQLGPREQLRIERLAKRIEKVEAKGFTRMELGLLGSRTLSYLREPLGAAGLARGLLVSGHEAPYDHVASFAFSGHNCFERRLDAVLAVLGEASFQGLRPLLDRAAEDEALHEAERLVSAIGAAARSKTGCPVIIATLPPPLQLASADSATPGSSARFRLRINRMLADGAAERRWLIWDQAALAARVGLERWFDPIAYHSAKAPFSVQLCPLAADSVASLLAAMSGRSARALVLDLDNTLWGGVIGDDGITGIRIGQNSAEGEAFVAFQHFLLGLRARGVVLAVCSKNTDAIAREPFRHHPDMVLKEEHIAVFQANWDDKATNIRAVAEALGLGLESLAYVDDNPAERERVRRELPLVSTIEVGEDPSFFIERIARSGLFEHLPLNSDDLARASSYGGRAAVAEIRARVGNYEDYLKSLEMQMTISPFDAVSRPRIVQLINKSNQFNLTTRRYDDEDVSRMQEDRELLGWQVRLDDRFAQHGMIGVVIIRKHGAEWEIDTWLQSCRVLERGVEQGIMNSLFKEASAAGVESIRGRYIPTERNGMVSEFYPRLGFEVVTKSGDGSMNFACGVARYAPHPVFMNISLLR